MSECSGASCTDESHKHEVKSDPYIPNETRIVDEPKSDLNGQPNQVTMDAKLAEFIQKHHVRFAMWNKANGNSQPPILKDKDGEYRWINRKERRKYFKKVEVK